MKQLIATAALAFGVAGAAQACPTCTPTTPPANGGGNTVDIAITNAPKIDNNAAANAAATAKAEAAANAAAIAKQQQAQQQAQQQQANAAVTLQKGAVAGGAGGAGGAVTLEKGAVAGGAVTLEKGAVTGGAVTLEKGAVEGGKVDSTITNKTDIAVQNDNKSSAAVGPVTQTGGTQSLTIVQPRQNPGSYAPTIAVAAGNGCFGAQWAISGGVSTPGASGSAGFTPGQVWNKECDESGDRRTMMVSQDSFAQAIAVKASVEKFEGIKAGFNGVKAAIEGYSKPDANGNIKSLPSSGVGMLFGIAGTVTPPAAPNTTQNIQSVSVTKEGVVTQVQTQCTNGKWNAQTAKCEPN